MKVHYPYSNESTLCNTYKKSATKLVTCADPTKVTCGVCKKSLVTYSHVYIMMLNKRIHDETENLRQLVIDLDHLLDFKFKLNGKLPGSLAQAYYEDEGL